MNKISLCMLVRDDEPTIGPLLAKLRPHVDEIVIVDTGSTDNSPNICREYADKWETFLACNSPETELIEDFAMARNRALELASHDWHMWIDGDDDFIGAEHLRALTNRGEESVMYLVPYEYSHDAQGRPTCIHWRENLVKPRDKFRWQIPVHEVLLPSMPMQVTEPAHQLRRIHRKGLSKRAPDPGRNLRILEKYVAAKGETDVRALYYYGVELHHTPGRLGDAIRVLRRYVELSSWNDEKCLAQLELARIYHHSVQDHNEAIRWAMQAMITKSWPEPYWIVSRSFYALALAGVDESYNANRSLHFAQLGLSIPEAQTVLFVNPMERFEIQWFVNKLLARAGRIEEALEACKAGLAGMPGDPELMAQALAYEDYLTKTRLVNDAAKLRAIKEQQTAAGLFTPGHAQRYEEVCQAIAKTLEIAPSSSVIATTGEAYVPEQPKNDGCLDIVFYLGIAYETWNPITLAKTGMGGSETMAWEMARRLRALGHRVRVFACCTPDQEGIFDGVEWLQSHRYVGTTCDVLIASRRADAVDDAAQLKAACRVLWIHDVHVGDALTVTRALRFDRILALSEWHKSFLLHTYSRANGAPYPIADLKPEDITVTRNGIDLHRFDADGPRNPRRVVYSSSPDRGLTTLLEMWPAILAEEPEAELHAFYGLANWEKAAAMNQYGEDHPWLSANALRRLKHQLRTVPRVTMHGRINQAELAREFLISGVVAYPTWFCCHGDTRISVPGDHRGGAPTVRIADMVGKSGFPVYAFNEAANRFEIRTCMNVWQTKIADELIDIELDSGQHLKVTPDHKILTFDGDWVEAGTVQPGDSLRALHYRYNVAIRDGSGRWTNEHRLVAEWKEGRQLRKGEHVDHLDPERLDNRAESLTVMTAAEHFSKTHKGKKLSKRHVAIKSAAMRETLSKLSAEEKRAKGQRAGRAAWDKINAMPEAERQAFFERRVATQMATKALRSADPEYAAKLKRIAQENLAKAHAARKKWELANPALAERRYQRIAQSANDARWGRNHKVVRVTRIVEPTPVYDMEVEGLHNFVAEGIVIHNCETSCIGMMEAQAAGLYIVTTPVAALNETVADRGSRVPGGWDQPNGPRKAEREEFIRSVVKAIRGEGQPLLRDELQAYAVEHFGLDELAKDWDRMLRELLAEVTERVVPRFAP